MKVRRVFLLVIALAALLLAGPSPSAAPIAITGDYAVEAAVDPNGTNNMDYVWQGRRVTRIPQLYDPSASDPVADITLSTAADTSTLAPMAARLGTSMKALLNTSKLYNPGVALGARRSSTPAKATPTPPPPTGKWIDVDIGSQTIMAHDGIKPIKTVLMSSGLGRSWTPQGNFKVYLKVAKQTMSGGIGVDRYYLPNVPWILYYSGDNAIHGAYWHNNFGVPMSHGCINVSPQDAKWFYDWGQVGTPVIIRP